MRLEDFLPKDYEIAAKTEGDFTNHHRRDIAALLWVAPDSPRPRPFIILLQQADGSYRLSLRTDSFSFNDKICDGGAGNWWCAPGLSVRGHDLVIAMSAGSAAGYYIVENEFRLISSEWYLVREAEYSRGGELTCVLSSPRKSEHCLESGVSRNFQTGVATTYSKFHNDARGVTRVIRSNRKFGKEPLMLFTAASWEESNSDSEN